MNLKSSHIWLLITAVLLLSIQIIAIVIYIYSFIPLVWSDEFLKGLEPTRDTLFYGVFLSTSTALTIIGVLWVLPLLTQEENLRKFKFWLGLEGVWCFLVLFCFFKWSTYKYPFWNVLPYENGAWLQPFFCIVCGLAVLSKVFFPEIEKFYRQLQGKGESIKFPQPYIFAAQFFFFVGVGALLYIPKPEDIVALSFVWDQWNHLDQVVAWLMKQGWYFSYEQTVQILEFIALGYLIALFYFIRFWLQSWMLAAIGVLLAIKFGMFYYGSAPCIWINPANTFLAHGWDIGLFWGLWVVFKKYPKKFYAASISAGIILVFFWFKSGGIMDLLGLDNQPMMAPLRVRQFFPYFMGFFVPIFYVFSLLLIMGIKNTQTAVERRLPIVFCIYGLMIFIDYLEHPMIGFYGSLMVPAIFIMLWWFKQLVGASNLFFKRGVYLGILVLALGALLTNRLMLTYPDIIFQDKDRFSSERMAYEQFDAIAQSAAMIRQLTTETQKVVLLSNFETALLMQAHRQSLFKNFPVMFSSFSNGLGGLKLKTKKECLELINSIEDENALYVFVDGRLLALPPQALGNSGLNAVLNFIKNHYTIYTRQGFLVALQRK